VIPVDGGLGMGH